MKILNRCSAVFKYISHSWEGPDGQFSYKRASQFVFIFLLSYLVLKDRIQTAYGFYSLVVLCATFLLLARIITPKELIELKTIKNPFAESTSAET